MNETRRVAHLSTAETWRGGERQALLLAEGLRERGVESVLIAPPGTPVAERFAAAEFPVEPLRARFEFCPLAIWRLRGILKRRRVDLVHAHDAHGVTLAGLAGRWAGVHRVCTRRVDFPVRRAGKYARGMERVICISEAVRRVCREGGVPAERMRVVLSGIDVDSLRESPPGIEELRASLGETRRKRLFVLNVANLTDHKGQAYLLQALPAVAAKLPQVRLLIAGTGELEAELKAQANVLALEEHVRFLGFRDDIPALLHACDLFVMSSHLEGLCTSVMDAMAAGRAVVATAAGGLPELVEDGKTGRVVPSKDPDALAAALLDLLQERKKRARMAREAAHVARMRFDKSRMADGTLAVYAELWGEDGRG